MVGAEPHLCCCIFVADEQINASRVSSKLEDARRNRAHTLLLRSSDDLKPGLYLLQPDGAGAI